MKSRTATCNCGKVRFVASGEPILTARCFCESCRTAGKALERLPGAPPVLGPDGDTEFMLFRKDRVNCSAGRELLAEHRLKPESPTRRLVATCCSTAMALDFTSGHWFNLFRQRVGASERTPIEMGLMAQDRVTKTNAMPAVPEYATRPGKFFRKLLLAWAAMGFRRPKIDYVKKHIDAAAG